MKVRFLQEADIPYTSAIVGRNYGKLYEDLSIVEMREMFGTAPIRPTYVVAEEGGTVIGMAGFMQSWMDYSVWCIFWVNVDPRYQRLGIGKQLVQRVIDEIKHEKDARLILLTTDSPAYYADHFRFTALQSFVEGTYQLMSLALPG